MSALNNTVSKYSFKTVTSYNNESSTRAFSGLNTRISNGSVADSGPETNVLLTALVSVFQNFSKGTLNSASWIVEKGVIL